MLRKTKIICTIGPATDDLAMLRQLARAGMGIVRLNMSHGEQKTHAEVIKKVRLINKSAAFPLALLLDTQGPEIRTGELRENFELIPGQVIDISASGDSNVELNSTIYVNYRDIIKDMNPGDRITVDNGLINLEVLEKTAFGLKCRVLDGGVMKSRRHINLPGIRVNLPSITPKDEADILFGLKADIDFIALSFVRSADDVEECRRLVARHNGHAQIIAKIEDKFGVENYKSIINAAHGVMVARGDLGVEVPIEELPVIQRKIVKECALQGKRVIVATHLLESMISNPIPTRAEVTDVANAAYEEVDAVMLSGETSVGNYPVKAVEYLDRITRRIELSGGISWARLRKTDQQKALLARAAVELADSISADAIVTITRRGLMADYLSSFHPVVSPVFAFTNMSTVRRRLMLNRGVYPLRIDFSSDPERTIGNALNALHKLSLVPAGGKVVLVSDVIAGDGRIDAIQIRQLDVKTVSTRAAK